MVYIDGRGQEGGAGARGDDNTAEAGDNIHNNSNSNNDNSNSIINDTFNVNVFTALDLLCAEGQSHNNASKWIMLGRAGGVNVDIDYTDHTNTAGTICRIPTLSERHCYKRAAEIDPTSAEAWALLATTRKSRKFSNDNLQRKKKKTEAGRDIVQHAHENKQNNNADADDGLGYDDTDDDDMYDDIITVRGEVYTRKECAIKAVNLHPNISEYWEILGMLGGGEVYIDFSPNDVVVGDAKSSASFASSLLAFPHMFSHHPPRAKTLTHMTPSQCFARALMLRNSSDAMLWMKLGEAGGGVVRFYDDDRWKTSYLDPLQCFYQAITFDPSLAAAWYLYGVTLEIWNIHSPINISTTNNRSYSLDSLQQFCEEAISNDPTLARAWGMLGNVGGGTVDGVAYNAQDCYNNALTLSAETQEAGGGYEISSRDSSFHSSPSFMRPQLMKMNIHDAHESVVMLEDGWRDSNFAKLRRLEVNSLWWQKLGEEGGGIVNTVAYTAKQCFEHALDAFLMMKDEREEREKERKEEDAERRKRRSSSVLGQDGEAASSLQLDKSVKHYSKALQERRVNEARLWFSLGVEGGGRVRHHHYSRKQALQRCLDINTDFDELDTAWFLLGLLGGGWVRRNNNNSNRNPTNLTPNTNTNTPLTFYSQKACYEQALSINASNWPDLWLKLSRRFKEGATVNNIHYSPRECLEQYLKYSPNDSKGWFALGRYGGGTVEEEENVENVDEDNSSVSSSSDKNNNNNSHYHRHLLLFPTPATTTVATSTAIQPLHNNNHTHRRRIFHCRDDCIAKAIMYDTNSSAISSFLYWATLERNHGGRVGEHMYSQEECRQQQLHILGPVGFRLTRMLFHAKDITLIMVILCCLWMKLPVLLSGFFSAKRVSSAVRRKSAVTAGKAKTKKQRAGGGG